MKPSFAQARYVLSPTAEKIAEPCDNRALLETDALLSSVKRESKILNATLRRIVPRMREAQQHQDIFASNVLDKQFHMTIVRLSGNR